jgi:hypothetical protein
MFFSGNSTKDGINCCSSTNIVKKSHDARRSEYTRSIRAQDVYVSYSSKITCCTYVVEKSHDARRSEFTRSIRAQDVYVSYSSIIICYIFDMMLVLIQLAYLSNAGLRSAFRKRGLGN